MTPNIFAIMLAISVIVIVPILFFPSKKIAVKPAEEKAVLKMIDFTDEILAILSKAVERQLKYADPLLVKDLVFHIIDHKVERDGMQLDCESVEVRFYLYEDKDSNKILKFSVEKNFGSPSWINNEMTYNYPTIFKKYATTVEDFGDEWREISKELFVIETLSPSNGKRVQEGKMSYWTEQKFGHMIY